MEVEKDKAKRPPRGTNAQNRFPTCPRQSHGFLHHWRCLCSAARAAARRRPYPVHPVNNILRLHLSSPSSSSSPFTLFALLAVLHRPDQSKTPSPSRALSPTKCCSITSSDQPPLASSSAASTTATPPLPAADHEAPASSDCDDGNRCKAARSPRSWLLLTAQELPLPEIRYKCRRIIARIGRCGRQGHVAASEFGYDPMSYALNFEDDRSRESDEEFPARNFSARLPVSPDRLLPAKLPREVAACS